MGIEGRTWKRNRTLWSLGISAKIMRTTEMAAVEEKLHELERQKEEMLRFGSPASLLQRLQDAMNMTDEESENLHKQLFVQIYKKLRTT
ncbi:vacuolar protein-sorting-associated protein 37 homolog 1 isoform X2 [Ziziphus jujuba]|uniref:Vacuolar protein-sorting-associated protein 37 homolog 1 isoform X2 n=1 Tax=Ziziphus jujuba TaxID=326968 RepID=A0ABM3ZU64_ZIZJJ|nr:vacuolar protein-sorting-associated protein 37 homolog 1 isoform X2 [Ziziphus jujuba]